MGAQGCARARASAMTALFLAGLLVGLAAEAVTSAGAEQRDAVGETAEERFTLSFQNLPLARALELLATRSGRRIALQGPDQGRPVTVRFEDALFESALGAILGKEPHLVIWSDEKTLAVRLLGHMAPDGTEEVRLDLQPRDSEEIGVLPLEGDVVAPEKPEGLGFRPEGLSIGPESDGSRGPSPAEKGPPASGVTTN